MSRVLIKQPNGKYLLWSSIVDGPIKINMTKEEYIEFKKQEAEEDAIDTLENYSKDYNYIYDLIFIFNMDDDQIIDFRNTLIEAGYLPKVIDAIIKKQLLEKERDQ